MTNDRMQREGPEPKIPGGVKPTFKQGKACTVELTVGHLVDDWFNTDFTFAVEDGVATLRSAEPQGDAYHFQQNEPARQKAYDAVAELPFISEVEQLND